MQISKILRAGRSKSLCPCSRSSLRLTPPAQSKACKRPRTLLRAENDQGTNGDLDLESLFAKEVQKRGLDSMDGGDSVGKGTSGTSGSTATSKSPFQSATKTKPADADLGGDQRQRSIAMVNEGLEGLFPRASELLKLGASVFLAFVPFILAITLMFGGIYAVFGEHFVHGGDRSYGRPQYYDPQELLSEPTADPYIPYQ